MRHTIPIHRTASRRGVSLVYSAVVVVVFVACCTLAVDWGRVQVAKTELGRACDAAARYAATGMYDGTALAKANWIGGQNTVDGQPLVFQSSDVETGTWDPVAATFTPGASSPTALRITARRTVPTLFGKSVGAGDAGVTVRAIATFNVTGYGLIGLNSIKMSGNSTASFWSGGTTGPTNKGNVGSNGSISMSGSSTIHGDAYYGPGKSVTGGSVTGNKTVLSTPLSFPNGDAGTYATTNDDWNVPSWAIAGGDSLDLKSGESLTLPGGVYYCNNFNMAGGSSLLFLGPATVYCYGTFNMSGSTTTYSSKAANLSVVMCMKPDGKPPGALTIGGSADLYATVYAPQSAITLGGSGEIYGSVLGLSVNMSGTSNIHYDMALNVNNGTISLVQ